VIVTVRQADGRLRILGVLPNREKDTVLEFLRSIPERLKRTIHTVCSDMYEGYTSAVQAILPDARLVISSGPIGMDWNTCASRNYSA
jgi:transposase